ncbi:hypothetical protein [Streptomyces sp. RKAG337]|uniref:hypothetical protein n=1 Tax=Streptomyces sp. RKAG337 TaxID=2893404 RepID=UPI002033240A|nr:hypothetical protein [Streptomyces sp. RKAG337]MCM2429072.1 hypothetical protein [Streptomyces sp. RKAG337]
MTDTKEQAPTPPTHMSGHCRTACPASPGQQPGPAAAFLHERCTLAACACPSHRGAVR